MAYIAGHTGTPKREQEGPQIGYGIETACTWSKQYAYRVIS